MYLKIDEELLKKVTNITNSTYKSKGDFITYDNIISMLEDLTNEYDVLKEKYDDFKQDVEDNYIKRPMSDYTGNADDDRF